MRGKGLSGLPPAGTAGITPAYAGKRCVGTETALLHQDHPRLCGEKGIPLSRLSRNSGSPPPMRGKDSLTVSHLVNVRITPAYAGKRIQ